MIEKIIIFTLTLALFTAAAAQEGPPAAAPQVSTGNGKFSWGSMRSLPVSPQFVSLEGRFGIGLSQKIQGYGGFSPNQSGINATGDRFNWKFDEGEITIVYLIFSEKDLKGTQDELENYTDTLKNNIVSISPNAKIKDEAFFKFNILFPASRTTFEVSENTFLMQRTYVVGNRLYRMVASFNGSENQSFVNAAFDTFKIISDSDIEAELQRKYEEMKPAALPQTPVSKLKPDLEDEGLKGKVKKIVEERQEIREGVTGGRQISHVYFYNENGNLTQSDYYDWKGNPSTITVYGFIDGRRVSNYKWTSYEYDPPPAMPLARPKSSENMPPPDTRYQTAYEYKYVDGKMAEEQTYSNTGKKSGRRVFVRKENRIEELNYNSEDKLNRKVLITLDNAGNIIEHEFVLLERNDLSENPKYRYSYEFDEMGNWVKRTSARGFTENGGTSFRPETINYRTITYW